MEVWDTMGFFSDLKEDLSLAVNGLMPEEALRVPIPEKEAEAQSLEEKKAEERNLEEQKDEEQEAEVQKSEGQVEKSSTAEANGKELAKEENTDDAKLQQGRETASAEIIVPEGTSVIAAGMTIAGDITSQCPVEVRGCVNGNIDVQGKLNITGHITGNSKAPEIVVSKAMVNGELVSTGTVYIETGSVVIGNIAANGAVIAGAIKGDLDIRGAVILESSAIVKGNIKSKSVQMNNGAVIEGICSQCYADVSPTAFFDDYRPEIKK